MEVIAKAAILMALIGAIAMAIIGVIIYIFSKTLEMWQRSKDFEKLDFLLGKRDYQSALEVMSHLAPKLTKGVESKNGQRFLSCLRSIEWDKELLQSSNDILAQIIISTLENNLPTVVIELFEAGVDIEILDRETQAISLNLSALNGHLEVVKLLLEKGVDANVVDAGGANAIIGASFSNEPEIVYVLIKAGADVNAKTDDGLTAIIAASSCENIQSVNLLINAGADVNASDKSGDTALIVAASCGNTQVVDLLIKSGAHINEKNNKGTTALIVAAAYGDTKAVDLLMKSGAHVNEKSNDGTTALIAAVDNINLSTSKKLLDMGADIGATDNGGESALSVILGKEEDDKNLKIISLLLEHDAPINKKVWDMSQFCINSEGASLVRQERKRRKRLGVSV